ncbi:MAG: DsbC family protein, partial [Pseudomonadota bacterium]|nr:DsbC family protein [Pseudomonadota bacterium]
DPDCPFCRAMEQKLDSLDNYTAYVLLLPLDELHPNASAAAKRIWCAADPSAAWLTYMHTQQLPEARDCTTPIAELQQLAHAHQITGTPTLVMPDGEIVEGMPDLDAFKSRLAAPSGTSH